MALQAARPVDGIPHLLDLRAHKLLPETRDAAGVAYKFQAFSLQLHRTNY